jgi:hypothetical protein
MISGNYPGAQSFKPLSVGARAVDSLSKETHVKRIIGFVAMCVLLLGVSSRAQAPAGMPKPAPEVSKMAYFAGTWNEEGTAHMGSMGGPDGKFTSHGKWSWMSGGFYMIGNVDMTTSMGPSKAMGVMGWDPKEKVYTYHEFDSTGESITAKGTLSGDTWSWTSDDMSGPTPMHTRVTIKEVSKTQYTFKMEASTDGKTWMTAMESTLTKLPAAPAK